MAEPAPSTSYGRIADRYEQVRGGVRRATELADALDPLLPSTGRVCDVGAGTGIVGRAVASAVRQVVGVDISVDMLHRAVADDRLPGRVGLADATALPFADGAVDAVTFVWVLHHVGDPTAALAEAARVLRPDGVIVVVSGRSLPVPDDIGSIVEPLNTSLRPSGTLQFLPDRRALPELGMRVTKETIATTTAEVSPLDIVGQFEDRLFSSLWDLDDDRWRQAVEPALDALRALPDPAVPRHRAFDHPVVVLGRSAGR